MLLLGVAAGVVLSTAVLTAASWPRTEVAYRSASPASLPYDGSRYFLRMEHLRDLSGDDSYRMVIGRQPDASYGHWLHIDTYLGAEGIRSATWTESEVRVRFSTGHELSVPAGAFTGGR
ncbi:hypothetical protein C0216_16480 [Streptomyces globosus]|uniref:Uncharacterized protein n=1 Tax=Streptomyces globosus TaxID=68209 RepID=A0A344U1R2_9ACTN|nr:MULTISPECIES: hypothetical protein [Streptomyces]AXE24833.1 hypothetical protein C0216_16480 [Streptomyces globosus]